MSDNVVKTKRIDNENEITIKIKDDEVLVATGKLLKLPYFEAILNGQFKECKLNVVDLSQSVSDMKTFKTALKIMETNIFTNRSLTTAKAIDTLHYLGYTMLSKKMVYNFFKNNIEAYEYVHHYIDIPQLSETIFPWYKSKACRDKVGNALVIYFKWHKFRTTSKPYYKFCFEFKNRAYRFRHDIRYLSQYIIPQCIDYLFEGHKKISKQDVDDMVSKIGVGLKQRTKNYLLLYLLMDNAIYEAMQCIFIGANVNCAYNDYDVLNLAVNIKGNSKRPRDMQMMVWDTLLEFGLIGNPDVHSIEKVTRLKNCLIKEEVIKVMLVDWKLPCTIDDVRLLVYTPGLADVLPLIDYSGIDLHHVFEDNRTVLDDAIEVNNDFLIDLCMKNRVKPTYVKTLQLAHIHDIVSVITYCKHYFI